MQNEMAACPFCGGKASLQSVSLPMLADCADINVSCDDCGAMGASVLFDYDTHQEGDVAELEAEAIAAWNTRPAALATRPTGGSGEDDGGWIIGNDAGDKWRAWEGGCPCWTADLTQAVRYHRREDAENAHLEDEDAWQVATYAVAIAALLAGDGR